MFLSFFSLHIPSSSAWVRDGATRNLSTLLLLRVMVAHSGVVDGRNQELRPSGLTFLSRTY
jgi:hypothetical protein